MQTKLTELIKATREGQTADAILRKCVHCGFCNATCPTYQLLGDELDGPRGRIYQIKQVLEGQPASYSTLVHLDRCLTCRNCETTCPSGVEYGKLVEIGRHVVEQQVRRPMLIALRRQVLKTVLPRRWLFTPLLHLAQTLRAVLPPSLAQKIPAAQIAQNWPGDQHANKAILLDGCVQPGIAPNINAAAARILDRLEIEAVTAPRAGCCGALRTHLNDLDGGLDDARRNIDAWWPLLQNGATALVMTASGCGTTVKEYGDMLAHDSVYAQRAAEISKATFDISEFLCQHTDRLKQIIGATRAGQEVAYHPPCSLQHAQKLSGTVEQVLATAGIKTIRCADSHLCCGSAGTYSLLKPRMATALRDRKLRNLIDTGAARIVTGNIGCITHLQSGTSVPVSHWIELLDQVLTSRPASAR
jgi:glycolate oxidase iron-sulfur subunit